jgi:DNA-binding MarR family transcriptional regulator
VIEQRVGFLLRLAHQRATANLSQAIGGHGLTPAAFVTLARLHESGPISQNELGRAVGMAPANIHAIVRRLRAAGLLDARPSPSDRRALLIDLSDSGRALLGEVLPDADAANRRTLAPLGAGEQRTLLDLLRRLAGAPTPKRVGGAARPVSRPTPR